MSDVAMKRILIYSHDTYGLGNIRRMLTVADHLLETHEDLSILVASGSPMLHAFRVSPRLDYIKLPCLSRTSDGDYAVKSLGLGFEATIRMRSQVLAAAMQEFEPDVVIVDKKPFGVADELTPVIEAASRKQNPPKFVLILRDILDCPETTQPIWEKNGYFDAIEDFYDLVLVLGDADIFDLPTEYGFPQAAANRVAFCGYVGRPPGRESPVELRARFGLHSNDQLVLLTPGGGEDGSALLQCFADVLTTGRDAHFHSIIVMGPEMPELTREEIQRQLAGRADVTILEFSDDMMSYVAASDLVVCMGGYNTVCEFLSAKRDAVVVPRVRPVREQLIRADLMAAAGLFQTVHPDDLTPDTLHEAIQRGLSNPSVPAIRFHGFKFDGLDQVEKRVSALLGE